MVTPKEEALECGECHAKEGRLKELKGFYMPGRDSFKWLDLLGYLMILGALTIVVLHTILRFVMHRKRNSETSS
jgi:hypothetical protein